MATKSPRWDLTQLYASIDDPKINQDLEKTAALCATFEEKFKGQLTSQLGDALAMMKEISTLIDQLYAYSFLQFSTNATNEKVQQVRSRIQEKLSVAGAHLAFFDVEAGQLTDADIDAQMNHAEVAHHLPTLKKYQEHAKYNLSTDVERALAIRSPFGAGEWDNMMDELENELTFSYEGKDYGFTEFLHKVAVELDSDKRHEILELVNAGLKEQKHTYFMAKTLNVVMGAKAVDDKERGFEQPIDSRNLVNRVSRNTVDALHKAVATVGAEESQRFYKLFAKAINVEKLRWADRNAPTPFADNSDISWDDCMDIVKKAYASFSPTLAGLIEKIEAKGWIDAEVYKGKNGGAYDYTFPTVNGAVSYNFINYQGSSRDVATVAHELGHGVHGLLAIEAQGPIQNDFPLNYAETASIFGEMVTFNHLLDACEDDDQKLALLLGKCQDFLNSVVRQISFSDFEIQCHNKRKEGKLSVEDFNNIWLDVTKKYYGADGDVFEYGNIENLWCYVGHFCRPFYVYSYAFGELFTQSLFAKQADLGDKFEPLYLDLLRSAGTKDAVEMMAPFGLNPEDPTFWENGIKVSLSKWIDAIEVLMAKKGML